MTEAQYELLRQARLQWAAGQRIDQPTASAIARMGLDPEELEEKYLNQHV